MTYFYRIAPWNIGKFTLFQWQDYMEKIAEIVKIFEPREKGKEAPSMGGGLSTAEKRRLIERAKLAGIKLPKKGI